MLKKNPKRFKKLVLIFLFFLVINTISYADDENADIVVEKDIKDVKNLGPDYSTNSPIEYLESRGWIFTYDDLVRKDGIYCIGRRCTFAESLCSVFRIHKKRRKFSCKGN